MDMLITRATVLTGQGPDRVFLITDLPSSFAAYSEPLVLSFEASKGTGVTYVKQNFNLDAFVADQGGNLKHEK
jgi:hypothetical protein